MFKNTFKKTMCTTIVVLLLILSFTGCSLNNTNNETGNVDMDATGNKNVEMGAIGNKIIVDGTVAYVAGENKILVPYDFSGDFSECNGAAYEKKLKGCENPRLPTDETDDLPEEVASEIVSFYGDIGGFWTSEEAEANIEFVGYESESLHYAGKIDNYLCKGNDGVVREAWGYSLFATYDTTTMGLLVLYDVIIDEFEFTDVEDTADSSYSTEPIFESTQSHYENSNVTEKTISFQHSTAQNNNENIKFEGGAAISDGWIYFLGTGGICRMKTDGSNKQLICDDYASAFVIEDNWIYYINPSDKYALYRVKTDGSNKQLICEDNVSVFDIEDNWIYYCNSSGRAALYRIKPDGSDKQKIIDWLEYDNIDVVDDWIYLGDLFRVKKDGTDLQQLDYETASGITVDEDWIYYRSYDMYRIKPDGSQKQKLNDSQTGAYIIKDDWIYYSNISDGEKFYRMKKDGSQKQLICK